MGNARKMVVVIDEPKNCDACRLRHMGLARCQIGGFSTSHFSGGKPVNSSRRHPGCLLRPLPDKLPTQGKEPLKRAAGYAYGWNDCIDEIGGIEDGKGEVQTV